MNETIYDDGKIAVTPTEIRAKGFVLYVKNVSSISVATAQPTKWYGVALVFPILVIVGLALFTQKVLGSLLGHQTTALSILPFLAVLPLSIMAVLAFLLRVSRLLLLTNGGPVIIASKIGFTDPYETVMQYKQIKEAIEQAISKQKS